MVSAASKQPRDHDNKDEKPWNDQYVEWTRKTLETIFQDQAFLSQVDGNSFQSRQEIMVFPQFDKSNHLTVRFTGPEAFWIAELLGKVINTLVHEQSPSYHPADVELISHEQWKVGAPTVAELRLYKPQITLLNTNKEFDHLLKNNAKLLHQTVIAGQNNAEDLRGASYKIPVGALPGTQEQLAFNTLMQNVLDNLLGSVKNEQNKSLVVVHQ
jgi:hypothetical protein